MFKVFVPVVRDDLAMVDRLNANGVAHRRLRSSRRFAIEAGRPRYGVDMTDDTIPLEAGLLERAISTTKGCYVGQEIVIRMLHRGGGRVAKRYVTFAFVSVRDARFRRSPSVDGREVGRLTSVAPSPTARGWIALGYVRSEQAKTDGRLASVNDDTAMITGFTS